MPKIGSWILRVATGNSSCIIHGPSVSRAINKQQSLLVIAPEAQSFISATSFPGRSRPVSDLMVRWEIRPSSGTNGFREKYGAARCTNASGLEFVSLG
jgi:hypothetical protein